MLRRGCSILTFTTVAEDAFVRPVRLLLNSYPDLTLANVTNNTLTLFLVPCTIHSMKKLRGKKMSHPPIYYTVRSCVRFTFWASLLFGTFYVIASIGDEKQGLSDCEYYYYPCETTTTLYDPYGYNIYQP